MKEELTREVLEAMKKCSKVSCSECIACGCVCGTSQPLAEKLATALLEEMDKPKDDVWKYAPDGITTADVYYGDGQLVSATPDYTFTRELPKTRARIMAEEVAALVNRAVEGVSVKEIEAALNKYAEELTNTKETE